MSLEEDVQVLLQKSQQGTQYVQVPQVQQQMQIPQQQQQIFNPSQDPMLLFAEQQRQNDMSMPKIGSLMKIQNANVALIALGVVASTMIGSKLAGIIPQVGKFATIIAGAMILMFVRNGPIRDIAAGVLIGGLAELVRGYTGMFGMPGQNMMSEDVKSTYGGGEGVYPTQPDRRTFA